MLGRATVTIEGTRTVTNVPSARTIRTTQRLTLIGAGSIEIAEIEATLRDSARAGTGAAAGGPAAAAAGASAAAAGGGAAQRAGISPGGVARTSSVVAPIQSRSPGRSDRGELICSSLT